MISFVLNNIAGRVAHHSRTWGPRKEAHSRSVAKEAQELSCANGGISLDVEERGLF